MSAESRIKMSKAKQECSLAAATPIGKEQKSLMTLENDARMMQNNGDWLAEKETEINVAFAIVLKDCMCIIYFSKTTLSAVGTLTMVKQFAHLVMKKSTTDRSLPG